MAARRLDRNLVRLDLAELQWQGAHTAISGSIPAWFLRFPGAPREGRASCRPSRRCDDQGARAFCQRRRAGATDFNIRVEVLRRSDCTRRSSRSPRRLVSLTPLSARATSASSSRMSAAFRFRRASPRWTLDDCGDSRPRQRRSRSADRPRSSGTPSVDAQGGRTARPAHVESALRHLPSRRHGDRQRACHRPADAAQTPTAS